MKKSIDGFAIKSEIAKSPKAKINSKGSPVLIFPPKRVNLFLSKGEIGTPEIVSESAIQWLKYPIPNQKRKLLKSITKEMIMIESGMIKKWVSPRCLT